MNKNRFKLLLVSILALGLSGCGSSGESSSGSNPDELLNYLPKAAVDLQIKKTTAVHLTENLTVIDIRKKYDEKYRVLSREISTDNGMIYYNEDTYAKSEIFTDSKLYIYGNFHLYTRVDSEIKNKKPQKIVTKMSQENNEAGLFLVSEDKDISWDGLFAKEQVLITYNRDKTIQSQKMIRRTIERNRVVKEEQLVSANGNKDYQTTAILTFEYDNENNTLNPVYYGKSSETLVLGLVRKFIPSSIKRDGEIIEQNTFTYYENGLIKSIKNKRLDNGREFIKITTYEYISKEEIDEEEDR